MAGLGLIPLVCLVVGILILAGVIHVAAAVGWVLVIVALVLAIGGGGYYHRGRGPVV